MCAATKLTSAPRAAASAAVRCPDVRSGEVPCRKRTRSIGSRVPPAETATRGPRDRRERAAHRPRRRSPPAPTSARPAVSAGQLARRRDPPGARLARGRDVRLRRRMPPHLGVHGGRDQHGASVANAASCQRSLAQPAVIDAIVFAVAGATITSSAACPETRRDVRGRRVVVHARRDGMPADHLRDGGCRRSAARLR